MGGWPKDLEWCKGTWEGDFRLHARKVGLEIESCHHDPRYGWTVLLDDGREFEALTTVGVRQKLDKLAGVRP